MQLEWMQLPVTQRSVGNRMTAAAASKRRLRTPRAKTVHPCRVCTEPVLADGPDTAMHPGCKVEAPRCSDCGRDPAMPDPHCAACASTGTVNNTSCRWCRPAPCVGCVVKGQLERHRHRRESAERIRPCPGCGHLAALPLGPLCVDCVGREAAGRDAWEATW